MDENTKKKLESYISELDKRISREKELERLAGTPKTGLCMTNEEAFGHKNLYRGALNAYEASKRELNKLFPELKPKDSGSEQ